MARRIPLPSVVVGTRHDRQPEGEYISQWYGNPKRTVAGRGRPRGATTIADHWIEQTAYGYFEQHAMPLHTAVQHAVGTLFRYIKFELAVEYEWETQEARQERLLLVKRMLQEVSPVHGTNPCELTTRATRQRTERKRKGWACLDEPIAGLPSPILCTPLIRTPEVDKFHPVVRRVYKRLQRAS